MVLAAHHVTKATDEEVLECVEQHYADGDTLSAGGVTAAQIAPDLPIAEKTVKSRLQDLADSGALERSWGFNANGRQQLGYEPADASGGAE